MLVVIGSFFRVLILVFFGVILASLFLVVKPLGKLSATLAMAKSSERAARSQRS